MALTGDQIEAITRSSVDLYRAAEEAILREVTRTLAAGLDAPDWAVSRFGALSTLRRTVERILQLVEADASGQLREALAEAYRSGRAAATTGIPAQLLPRDPDAVRAAGVVAEHITRAGVIENLAAALMQDVGERHSNVLRHVLDVYRTVIQQATAVSVAGGQTRRQASQWAYQRFIDQGLSSFTDSRGRVWRLSSYVEMAVRTVTQRAAVQGQTDRLTTLGVDTVIVSDSPRECPKCRPWEGKVLSISGRQRGRVELPSMVGDGTVTVDIAGTVDEARADGLMHPNCFPAEVLVSAPSGVVAADARWYQGPLVVIHTASGDELPVTPNHPVLTPEGWVAAGALKVGQSVMRYRGDVERVAEGGPDDEQIPARIGDVFDALRQASPVPPVRVPVAPEQFHGDGLGSDVDVVLADGLLRDGVWQQCRHGQLLRSGVSAGTLLASGALLQVVHGAGHAAHGVVGGGGEGGSFGLAEPGHSALGRVAGIGAVPAAEEGGADRRLRPSEPLADLLLGHAIQVKGDGLIDPRGVPLLGDASGPELPVEGGSVDLHGGRDLAARLARLVSADRVVEVEQRGEWAGHVYNLQSGDGWYVAGGIVVHNCTHSLRAYLPGATRRPTGNLANPKGYEAKDRQRAIERNIRRWKEREAGALDDAGKATAAAKVRQWQATMRDHLAANPELKRLPYREQIGAGNLPR